MACVVSLQAQTFDARKMDSLFSNLAKNNKAMGSISLFQRDSEIYHFTFGYADLKSKIKPTPNTKYKIGSVTKMFTATVIMQLVAEGKLSLQTTLHPYFPEIPNAREITIEELLKHHSGLTDKKFQTWMVDGKNFRLTKDPEYANANYGLLSEIAEQVEKKDFGDMLRTRIFEPCGLKNTHYGNLPDSVSNVAKSYRYQSGWKLVEPGDLNSAAGAGAIVSTPSDVNTFLFHLFSGDLMPPKELEQMKKIRDGYGSGMMRIQFGTHYAYSHAGQIEAFQARATCFTGDLFSITCCFNGINMGMDDILFDVLSLYYKL